MYQLTERGSRSVRNFVEFIRADLIRLHGCVKHCKVLQKSCEQLFSFQPDLVDMAHVIDGLRFGDEIHVSICWFKESIVHACDA